MKLKIVKLNDKACLPRRAYPCDAGMDCKAISCTYLDKDGLLCNHGKPIKVKYDLGIGVEVPKGFMLLAFPKSSVCKRNMVLSNSVGVIDYGFQGSISVTFLMNDNSIEYDEGDAVIQLVLAPIVIPEEIYWGEFEDKTERGTGGHGSTGNLFDR